MAPELPPELQYKIVSYLSQKDTISSLTVCKNWLPNVLNKIYTKVGLNNSKQCDRFIECLKENKTSVKGKIEETNGYLVKEIILDTSYIYDSGELCELQELTPMVTQFGYTSRLSLTDEHLYHFAPLWKHLNVLPVYHEDNSEDWIPLLGKQLIYLGCHANELDYITKSSTTKSITNDSIPNDHSFLTITPTFPKLKTLELHLEYTFKPVKLSTIEWIHQICPVLTSLTLVLQDLLMIKDIDSIENQVTPYTSLNSLKLDFTLLSIGVGCFDYFIHKYQHLNQLEIIDHYSIDVDPDDDEREESEDNNLLSIAKQNSKNGILKLVTSNPQLSYLYIDSEIENTAVPWDDFKELVKKYQVPLSSSINQLEKVSLWRMPINLLEVNKEHFYDYYLQFR